MFRNSYGNLSSFLKGNQPKSTMALNSTPAHFMGLSAAVPADILTTIAPRRIARVVPAIEANEGVGVRVHRSIGTHLLKHFSPFLMLDYAEVAEGQGFPDHPHRGQETVSYILSGKLEHEDFAGNKGVLQAGDLQFMTAGRGIMHSEMPLPSDDGSPSIGLQLWVDLPEHLKMSEPRYRDVHAKEIREATADDGKVKVKVISGSSYGVESKHKDVSYTPVWYLDFTVQPGGRLKQTIPEGWNAFAYVLSGSLVAQSQVIKKHHIATLEKTGDSFEAQVPNEVTENAHFVLIAGLPLDQAVVQHGPFVMTSQKDVRQAVMDFVSHTNGFERAKSWESQAERRRRSLS
jgi:redox-sensitive bicupin YhaK (pirin superfamily)